MAPDSPTIVSGPRGTAHVHAASVAQAEDKYKYKYLIAIAVTLAAVLELIDTSIVNVAIPHMMGNLGATLDEISWVSTGYIVDNYNWAWIFYINIPLGIIAMLMVMTYVHDAEHQERADTIDVTGFLLLATCVGSLQWMLEKGERYDWFDSRLVTSLAIASA